MFLKYPKKTKKKQNHYWEGKILSSEIDIKTVKN